MIRILPPQLAEALDGYTWREVTSGYSGARVFRLAVSGRPTCYLKQGPLAPERTLLLERQRLEWLAGRLPVPQVQGFAQDDRWEYLVLSEVSGRDGSDRRWQRNMRRLVERLAQGLRQIHALPTEGCPFDHRLDVMLPAARRRLVEGWVDERDFHPIRRGRPASERFTELVGTRPASEDLVFTHGDYCLPNVLLNAAGVSGFIDLGRAGLADRYQDLALAARSLDRNCGTGWAPLLFEEYGIPVPDWQKIGYYQLLDEFF